MRNGPSYIWMYRCNSKSALQTYDLSEKCRRTSHDILQYWVSISCYYSRFVHDPSQRIGPPHNHHHGWLRLALSSKGIFRRWKEQTDGKDLFQLANPSTTRRRLALDQKIVLNEHILLRKKKGVARISISILSDGKILRADTSESWLGEPANLMHPSKAMWQVAQDKIKDMSIVCWKRPMICCTNKTTILTTKSNF